jgi:hypothetical protein
MSIDYATQSAVSDPGPYASLFDNLPTDTESVTRIAQGLVYHYVAGKFMFGYEPPQERMGEIDTRSLKRMIDRILAMDNRPLQEARDYDKRIIGCCRDFSLIACAILRHHGIPARLRYGFAAYFDEGYWGDHVIVERWTGERWLRFDPQLAGVKQTDFDLFDINDEAYVTGGRAWQMYRQEGADPARFGLGPHVPQISGTWFIVQRMLLDIASLHKQELLCWDEWSYKALEDAAIETDEALLDRAAHLSQQPELAPLTELWNSEEKLRIPMEVTCYSPVAGPQQVVLRNGVAEVAA